MSTEFSMIVTAEGATHRLALAAVDCTPGIDIVEEFAHVLAWATRRYSGKTVAATFAADPCGEAGIVKRFEERVTARSRTLSLGVSSVDLLQGDIIKLGDILHNMIEDAFARAGITRREDDTYVIKAPLSVNLDCNSIAASIIKNMSL